jgi:hypothetical protein
MHAYTQATSEKNGHNASQLWASINDRKSAVLGANNEQKDDRSSKIIAHPRRIGIQFFLNCYEGFKL